MKTKQEITKFLKEQYNPDTTTIELGEVLKFFEITQEDLQ